MNCENQHCHSEASVKLSVNLLKPTWLCPYCAAKTLRAVNPVSFLTIKEQSMNSYKKDRSESVAK